MAHLPSEARRHRAEGPADDAPDLLLEMRISMCELSAQPQLGAELQLRWWRWLWLQLRLRLWLLLWLLLWLRLWLRRWSGSTPGARECRHLGSGLRWRRKRNPSGIMAS